jgi:hypothetical protein
MWQSGRAICGNRVYGLQLTKYRFGVSVENLQAVYHNTIQDIKFIIKCSIALWPFFTVMM